MIAVENDYSFERGKFGQADAAVAFVFDLAIFIETNGIPCTLGGEVFFIAEDVVYGPAEATKHNEEDEFRIKNVYCFGWVIIDE